MTIIESILALFTDLSEWLVDTIPGLMAMFYDAQTGLTFLGALAVAGLGISVIFLLIGSDADLNSDIKCKIGVLSENAEMPTRTEGYTKYIQGQRIVTEKI